MDEDSSTWQDGEGYGQGKAASERVAHAAMGGRFATVRAGLIVGTYDNIFRLPWWVRRIAAGRDGAGAGSPDRELQIIDARDLARFCLDLAEQRIGGAFNGTGRSGRRRGASSSARPGTPSSCGSPTRGSSTPRSSRGRSSRCGCRPTPIRERGASTRPRRRAGLTTRPVAETVQDVRSWLENGGEEAIGDDRAEHRPPNMSAEREAALLQLV